MMDNYKTIAYCVGGSRLYGLETEDSDWDYRFVFLNTSIADILGINRFEEQTLNEKSDDETGHEVKKIFRMLKKGNLQIVELLFNNNWMEKTWEWDRIQENRNSLIDPKAVFKSAKGYLNSEYRFALGKRTGKLGGKRFEAIQNYGYSPKNVVQFIRISYLVTIFLQWGKVPVDFRVTPAYGCDRLADTLIEIKQHPEKYPKNYLDELMKKYYSQLIETYDREKRLNRGLNDYHFDENLANRLCLEFYSPHLKL